MASAECARTLRTMFSSMPHLLRRGTLTLALGLLVPAAPAAAGTITPPAASAGDAAVVLAKARPGARPAVARAPRGVVVLGAVDRRGAAVFAVVRPPGAAAGAARVRVAGAVRVTARASAVLTSPRTLPASACASAGPASGLRRVLRRGALSAADARALGAALERRACGRGAEAGDAALLQRLGLRVPAAAGVVPAAGAGAATPGPVPAPGGGPTPAPPATPPGGGTPPPGGDEGTYGACRDGLDNDGDGQVDARGEGPNPDPGCMNANDRTENSERTASAACAAVSGVSMNTADRREAFAAVNRDCGDAIEIAVTVAPGILACDVMTAVVGYVCANHRGVAWVHNRLMNGSATDIFDIPISLTGDADCSKLATIAITRPDLSVEEIVEPIQSCPGG